jgi:hypothetical protein
MLRRHPRRIAISALFTAVVAGTLVGCSSTDGSSGTRAEPTDSVERSVGEPTAAGSSGNQVQELYVVRGAEAVADRIGDAYRLTIDVPEDDVLVFDDRPHRGASHMTVGELVTAWPTVFAGDPPNAALSAGGDGGEIDVAVELTEPVWDERAGRLTVTARPIGDDSGSRLPSTMRSAALFIDDAQTTISLNLTNLTQIPLTIQSAMPEIGTWTSWQPLAIGLEFGVGSDNGPTLEIGYFNPTPGVAFTAQLTLAGELQNFWQLTVAWDAGGSPSVTLTQLSGQGIALSGQPLVPGEPAQLKNLNPAGGAANYQAIFAT